MNQPTEMEKLLRLAERDLIAFRILRDASEVDPSLALFHAQQCVEKCLKAVLVSRGKTIAKIHDLSTLARSVVQSGVQLPVAKAELDRLTPYAATMRYDELEYAAIDYKSTTKIVEAVFNWAKGIVGGTNE